MSDIPQLVMQFIFRAFPAKSTSPGNRPGNIRTWVGCPNDFFLCWVNGDVTGLLVQGTQLHLHLSFPQLPFSPYKLKLFSALPPAVLFLHSTTVAKLAGHLWCQCRVLFFIFESKVLHQYSTHPLHCPKRSYFWQVLKQCYSPISASCKVKTGISKT